MSDHIWLISGCLDCFHSLVHICRINGQNHAESHIISVVHHLFFDIALISQQSENGRNRIAVFLYNGARAFF